MGKKTGFSHRNPNGLVSKYIGTSYDIVKEVYENLDAINKVADISVEDLNSIEEHEREINNLQILADQNAADIVSLDNRVSTLESIPTYDDTEVKNDIDALEVSVGVNSSNISSNDSRITALEAIPPYDDTAISAEIDAIELRVGVNESDITDLNTDFSGLNSRVSDLEAIPPYDDTAILSRVSQNEADIINLNTRLTTEENKEVIDITARADATQAISDAANAQSTADTNTTNLANLIQDLIDIQETHAAVGNTVSDNTGIPNPTGTISVSFTGTGDELLTPPVSPQSIATVDLNGYIPIPLEFISQSGLLSDNGDGGIIVGVGGAGNYETPHAWLDMSSSVNGNNVGFIFGILRGSQIVFSQRVTGGRLINSDDRTNISGGGFVDGLQEGDIIYVYGSAELTSTVTIYDANLGLSMRKKV